MGRFSFVLLLVLFLVGAGLAAYLLIGDMPAPTTTIEKVLPDDRLPR